jgi:hypothetical protein
MFPNQHPKPSTNPKSPQPLPQINSPTHHSWPIAILIKSIISKEISSCNGPCKTFKLHSSPSACLISLLNTIKELSQTGHVNPLPRLTQGAPCSDNRCPRTIISISVMPGIHRPVSTCFIIVDAFSNFLSQAMQSIFLSGLESRAWRRAAFSFSSSSCARVPTANSSQWSKSLTTVSMTLELDWCSCGIPVSTMIFVHA